jgi:hypothetical protein
LLLKELCSWRIFHGVTVPTKDTHESVVYVPFLISGLALPVSPFFHGLLDFYELNLTHLNLNFILQVSIFVQLCEAFLRILPHFGLWKYLYHCRPGMLGDSTNLLAALAWSFVAGGNQSTSTFLLRTTSKGGTLSGSLWRILENERQTYFKMPASTDDAEIDFVLSLLAGESSDSTQAEPMAITAIQELGEAVQTQKPEGARPKRPCRVSRPTAPIEEKRKKRRLRRLS